jgi:hypothetical protein
LGVIEAGCDTEILVSVALRAIWILAGVAQGGS